MDDGVGHGANVAGAVGSWTTVESQRRPLGPQQRPRQQHRATTEYGDGPGAARVGGDAAATECRGKREEGNGPPAAPANSRAAAGAVPAPRISRSATSATSGTRGSRSWRSVPGSGGSASARLSSHVSREGCPPTVSAAPWRASIWPTCRPCGYPRSGSVRRHGGTRQWSRATLLCLVVCLCRDPLLA